ncbi:MAG TPA: FrgA protein, partial [Myxococcaceae bacterium]|nr:FrgA protein [Myxococcaceae bacterium]
HRPAPQTPPPAAATPASPSEWTLPQARAALKDASHDRDRIIHVALQFARGAFEFAAAFAVVRGAATGWAAEGEGAEAFRQAKVTFPLDTASAFRTVALTRASYIGPPPQDPVTAQYLSQMRRTPRMMFLFPVEVKEHLICILYGDNAKRTFSQLRLSELLLLGQDLPAAFQELMIYRKQRFGGGRRWALDFEEVVGPRLPPGAVDWSPSASPGAGEQRGRRAASTPGKMMEGPVNPPSDFGPLLKKLTGPDAAARASAIAELARTPEASARVLGENFPGPTAWSRVPVSELPEPDELGPIPAALSRLGRPGAQAVAPLLDSPEPDVRYYALLTAGSLQFAELVGGVLRGLFDLEPDLSSAARAAASALRRVPRLASSLREIRLELAGKDPVRRALAARALGVLHDREAIDGLINLTGSDDGLCAQAAADALREITRASFGSDQRRWASWWAENRSRSRAEWLVAALRHPELEVRLAAIEELSKALSDTLGYFADAPPAERDAAAKRWDAELTQNPRLRNLQ